MHSQCLFPKNTIKIRPQGVKPGICEVLIDATLLDEIFQEQVEQPAPQLEENLEVSTQQMQQLIAEENDQNGDIDVDVMNKIRFN